MAVDRQLPQVSSHVSRMSARLIASSFPKSIDGGSLTMRSLFLSRSVHLHTSVGHACKAKDIADTIGLGSGGPSQAFAWILALSTVAGLLAWMTLCICYLRFYAACKVQGLDRNTLPFKSRLQPYAGWVGAIGSLSECAPA